MIKDLMDRMEDIEYGFKDEEGNNILTTDLKKWDDHFNDFYYLQTPEELLKSKCGVCWDQVELEREYFEKKNIPHKTYFVMLSDDDMLPSHTFLTFEKDNICYWYEHSWNAYCGIQEYLSEEELLKDVMEKFRKSHPEVKKDAPLYLYEYEKPKYHITCDEFYKYIETQKEIKTEES